MKSTTIFIENVKCSGCINTIQKNINALKGVNSCQVDLASESITIMHNDEFNVEEALNTLKKLGYPEKGQNNVVDKAKSYVSCVIGKMS